MIYTTYLMYIISFMRTYNMYDYLIDVYIVCIHNIERVKTYLNTYSVNHRTAQSLTGERDARDA